MTDPTTGEDAVSTAAEREALAAVRNASGETAGPMERHCLRVFAIARELAARRGLEVDREVLLVAAFIHDLGLYDSISRGGVYVKDGAEYATELVQRHGWSTERTRLCAASIERHHELRSQWALGTEVEMMRRADLVDVSAGVVAFGLERSWLRELNAAISRDGTYGEVARLLAHAIRERPLTLPANLPAVNFVEDVLEAFPSSVPALVTISADGERRVWAFGELIARSAGLAGALASRGVARGDVVMTLVGNRIEWVLTLLACWRMGAVALPCNTQLRRNDLALRATVTNARLCVGDEELLGELGDAVDAMTLAEVQATMDEESPQAPPLDPATLDPEDPALIVFTSGTTGEPRAVVHAQRYLAGQRMQATRWMGARAGELVWCTTATGWSKSARNVFVAPWLCGATALLHEGRFDPSERLAVCEREGVNVLCQAPTEYRMLAKRTSLAPLPQMRRMISAGEALNPEVIDAFRSALGLEIADGYGQTETGQVTGNLDGDPVREGSMGRPLPGIEIRIADGELQILASSSPTFFSRYVDSGPFDGEWWPTGDIVRAEDDRYLFYEGRTDDLILSSGYRIGPFEVESALLTHPAVAEAAVVPAPDPDRGAVVRAIVVLRQGRGSKELAGELQDHVKAVTAPYKFPRIVEFSDTLPKTASGKIKRAELRASGPQQQDD